MPVDEEEKSEEEKERERKEEEERERKAGEEEEEEEEVDVAGEIKGLKAQIDRLAERNSLLEKSLELTTKHLNNEKEPETASELSKDLVELEKALDPILSKRRKSDLDPLVNAVARTQDQLDSISFRAFLQSEYPDLAADDANMDRLNQEIEDTRNNAASRGSWISREEAFYFVEGVRSRQEKATSKNKRKKESEKIEKRRKIDADLSDSEERSSNRRDPGAGIAEILEKAERGQVLTEDEKKKRFDHLKSVSF